ncbi:MAG: exonuclease domain-containing protein [Coriobacteriia bacterium]
MLAPTLLAEGSFVTVDIETTGCRPGTSSIIELGAARIEGGAVVDTFTMLVHPTEPIPAAIERLTGISEAMVAQAPSTEEAVRAFAAFARGAVLVAHNHRFDLGFLDYECELVCGSPFPRPILDTLCLARALHPEIERNNLRDLAAFYGVPTVPNHRALPDAVATAEILIAMIPELAERGITTAGETARLCGIADAGSLSEKLTLATNIPDEPGVYLFRNGCDAIVYVGRARNLRTKVRSHFYATTGNGDAPAGVTEAVQYIQCSSALDAQLLEARLRYRYQPEYNHNTTTPRTPLYLHVDTEATYPTILVTQRRLRSGDLFGPLTNRWAATTTADALSRIYGLRRCRRTIAECRAYRCARRDRGACSAEAIYAAGPERYRERVSEVLATLRDTAEPMRERLQEMRDRLARGEEFEQAAYFRDALRAYDRTIAGLAMAKRSRALPVSVLVEGDSHALTLSVLINGWRFTTLRAAREGLDRPGLESRVRRSLERALRRAALNPPLTAQRLEEMAVVDAYVQQHSPLVIPVDGDSDAATAAVMRAVRKLFRIPRRRHATPSGD